MKYDSLVKKIIEALGGRGNIQGVIHCATRLRFTLVDESKVDEHKVSNIKEVLKAVNSGGQYQLVIGSDVDEVYKELIAVIGDTRDLEVPVKKKNIFDKILGAITGSISPVIPLLAGAGMGKVLLLVLTMTGILDKTSQTYTMLNMIFDAGFFFMPAFVGFSTARMFGSNEYLGAFLGLCLVHPTWNSIVKADEAFSFIGMNVPLVKYSATLVPVLMSVWAMSYIERFVKKIVPDMIKVFAEPLLIALVSLPLAFLVIAPIGDIISSFVATGSMFLYDKVGIAAIAILASLYPWLVSIGIHKALSPISIALVAEQGFDPVIRVVALCSNMAQASASLAVSVRAKNKNLKSLAFSSSITAYLGGITEPAMYGVNLKLKRPMYASMIGAAVAGIFAGAMKIKAFIYVTPGLLSMAMWISEDENFIFLAIITLIIASVVTFAATLVLGFDESEFEGNSQETNNRINHKEISLFSPVSGKLMQQSDIQDATFSSNVIGKGFGIVPNSDVVVAPFNGVVSAVFNTHHAIGITSDEGIELLIHVGIDTVKLNGKGFTTLVRKGDRIHEGDTLLTFAPQQIKDAGYDTTVIVVVTNPESFANITIENNGVVNQSEHVGSVIL